MTEFPPERAVPHPVRLIPTHPGYAAVMGAHDAAMAAGDPGYDDPRSGLYVFTARFLWERGYCCDSGCRHCPYLER